MNTKNYIIVGISSLIVVVAGIFVVNNHRPKPPNPHAVCHLNGKLPDKNCTPGTTYAGVTQANIHQTICVKGWTATIRPPQSYTQPLKVQSIKDYGYADTNLAHYEEDHYIPLELGGSPTDVKNLWAEPGATPNPKDAVERSLRAKVCNGTLSLAQAQQEISTDWTKAK